MEGRRTCKIMKFVNLLVISDFQLRDKFRAREAVKKTTKMALRKWGGGGGEGSKTALCVGVKKI